MKVYSVRDKAVEAFMPPFFCKSDGEAIRSLMDAVNNRESQFFRHPGDFELYRLGEWDEASGLFSSSGPSRLISANELAASVA